MKNSLYIDIHVIQTLPPSCVNRDDTGAPKTAVYGGVERARVSSQAWKHAMREYFKTIFAENKLGSRTKQIPSMITNAIMEANTAFTQKKAEKAASDALKCIGITTDDKKNENSALFFISKSQVKALAELAAAGEKDKDTYRKAMKDNPSLDIALFGRMVANDSSLNYDAAAQVAHAISTHEVQTEYDYFTAVDDEQAEDESGAGHLGTVDFNSSTLYRYATVNVTELASNIKEDVAKIVRGFVEAFTLAMPTGKQNTFANRTLPDLLYVAVRRDQPVNLSGAFEEAIGNDSKGYRKKSCERLVQYSEKLYNSFADRPELALGCGDETVLSGHVDEILRIDKLLDRIEGYIQDKG